ncbi:MAG TPA: hypothetical protein VFE51_01610 [Verrucomicrobiae bacterium]|nr:hypothetical protein [Verrucomicrobiae bacterium]
MEGDVSAQDKARLFQHLKECPDCSAELAGWRRSVQKLERLADQDQTRTTARHLKRSFAVTTVVRWAVAAAIVLYVGFTLGRLSIRPGASERVIAERVREEVRGQLRNDLLAAIDPNRKAQEDFQKQLREGFKGALDDAVKGTAQSTGIAVDTLQLVHQQLDEHQRRLLELITTVRNQQIADYVSLRRDLETAVSAADTDLQENSVRLNELADTVADTVVTIRNE